MRWWMMAGILVGLAMVLVLVITALGYDLSGVGAFISMVYAVGFGLEWGAVAGIAVMLADKVEMPTEKVPDWFKTISGMLVSLIVGLWGAAVVPDILRATFKDAEWLSFLRGLFVNRFWNLYADNSWVLVVIFGAMAYVAYWLVMGVRRRRQERHSQKLKENRLRGYRSPVAPSADE